MKSLDELINDPDPRLDETSVRDLLRSIAADPERAKQIMIDTLQTMIDETDDETDS